MSGVVAENKVRKFKILPFGHRREHLAAYVPNIKEQASLRTGFFSLFSSLSLSRSANSIRSVGSENSAGSSMRLARLSSRVQINGSAPRVGRWPVSCSS